MKLPILLSLTALGLQAQVPVPVIGTLSFTNSTSITIRDNTNASIYPSTLWVTNMGGVITDLRLTLEGLSHTYPGDIDMLLVGPNGQKALFFSDAGENYDLNNAFLIFRDSASSYCPQNAQINNGTHKPSNYEGASDTFLSPAPGTPYTTNLLATFTNTSPNGTWSLYIMDDGPGDSGTLSKWSLRITTEQFCTNCITTNSPLPTLLTRYGYYVIMQWTNTEISPLVSVYWTLTNSSYWPDADAAYCHYVPTQHVCSTASPYANTNTFANEKIVLSDTHHFIAIWWAPNAYSNRLGFNVTDLSDSPPWTEVPVQKRTNTVKDPYNQDPWWPVVVEGSVGSSTNHAFFYLRRMDWGTNCSAICF